ncbi:hypothetical protein GXW71_18630 [Roseomonas hellenica]|uniref:Uncharacterized protein n=1 Tax=Plastoroseomonas hellenica TaxID=2687306 RepID=A0ABS5F1N0_9PROT|nr:hypothetical protein [Plastoroseomonas hellenica]MBR0666383.1 hypothetical protein [Plastoroseomonas hellenica]
MERAEIGDAEAPRDGGGGERDELNEAHHRRKKPCCPARSASCGEEGEGYRANQGDQELRRVRCVLAEWPGRSPANPLLPGTSRDGLR